MSNETMNLQEFFGTRVLPKTCGHVISSSGGYCKGVVCRKNLHTLKELKTSIRAAIENFVDTLHKVSTTWPKWYVLIFVNTEHTFKICYHELLLLL
jgi:hypothetical protein